MNDDLEVNSTVVLRRARFLAFCTLAALLAGALIVLAMRIVHARSLDEAAAAHAVRYVTLIRPVPYAEGVPVTLPGTLQGYIESTVYARSSGYILRWSTDIGALVHKGDLLAEITAPELDEQLRQAEASRVQAAASAAIAKSTAQRWVQLRAKDAVTQQDFDERSSTFDQASANLAAAEANVARLRNLKSFNEVTAPFDGVVTRRNIDVGDLVDAGNGGLAKALFSVAQVDPLRLYVYVPQVYAQQVQIGSKVAVHLAERPRERFEGVIARTARAIDTGTRTMQVEIRVPNPRGALIVGSYVEVLLPIKDGGAVLVVPTNALLFRPEGPRVAVVDGAGRVRLSAVELGTDFGTSVAVLSGLDASDRVVLNPADSLADGDIVSVAVDRAAAAPRPGT